MNKFELKNYKRKWYLKNKKRCFENNKKYLLKKYGITKIDLKYRHKRRKQGLDNRTLEYRKWREKNPEKYEAHKKLNIAVKKGIILKQNCQKCGINKFVHAHHEDYSKPLKIVWLCALHHKKRH